MTSWRTWRGRTTSQVTASLSEDSIAMVRSPKTPSGHGSEAPGKAAINWRSTPRRH
ncbi:hypothetical protein QFZ30_001660 [Arthrobacter pascens]|nr:hypothetical protein [Arthrobacter pascens]